MLYKRLLIYVLAFYTLCIFFSSTAYAENPNVLAAQAAKEYDNNNFESAAELFGQATKLRTDNYKFSTGLGNSKYRLNDFTAAAEAFEKAVFMTKKSQENAVSNDELRQAQADTLYNLGNSLVQLNKLEEAINNYEESLKIVPEQKDVINNLEYAKKLLEEQKKEDSSCSQNSSDDNQQQDDEDNQNAAQNGTIRLKSGEFPAIMGSIGKEAIESYYKLQKDSQQYGNVYKARIPQIKVTALSSWLNIMFII